MCSSPAPGPWRLLMCTLTALALSGWLPPVRGQAASPSTTGWTYPVAGGGGFNGTNNGTASGYADGSGARASRFHTPSGIAICAANASIAFVADSENNRIRWIEVHSPARSVHTLAGNGVYGYTDHASALSASFRNPTGVACDPGDAGFPLVLYIADSDNHAIRLVTITSLAAGGSVASVSTLSGMSGVPGFADGALSTALWRFPTALRVDRTSPSGAAGDGWGGVVVADSANHRVRWIPLTAPGVGAGWVETLSGSGAAGLVDGPQPLSRLNTPLDVSIGPAPTYTLYITMPHAVRSVSRGDGNVTRTVAGGLASGFVDGDHATVRFFEPSGVHVVANGDIYIADTTNNAIRVWVSRTGLWRTLLGRTAAAGSLDGSPITARLRLPTFLTTAEPGREPSSDATTGVSLYISDSGNHKIRRATSICFDACQYGTCNATASCACQSGWSRDDCSFGLCDPGLCVNGTVCTGYNTCNCLPGFEGAQCDVPICAVPCANAGNCTAPDTCTCAAGWSGSTIGCTVALCAQTCANGGNCTAPDSCSCASGWTGSDCTTAVCGSPCLNGGTCIAPDVCACATGYIDAQCGTPNCTEPCRHGGTCSSPDICNCTSQWSGPVCDTPVCALPCAVTGNCTAPDLCTCQTGYNGTQCQHARCDGVGNCQHNGVCILPDVCSCVNNWLGPNCNTPNCVPPCGVGQVCSSDLNVCVTACSSPCLHGGSCSGVDTCSCVGGWIGPTCATAPCPLGCYHGTCTAPSVCECDAGYSEANCSVPLCTGVHACHNGGQCIAPQQCRCPTGMWSGDNCTAAICNAAGVIPVGSTRLQTGCLGGGLCVAPETCACSSQYRGSACQEAICADECSHGLCVAPERCQCDDGWGGATCASAIEASAWSQWYWYWVAILISGSIGLLLCVLWHVKMARERARKDAIERELRERKPRPIHWRAGDDDPDDSDNGIGEDAEEQREAAEAKRAAELLAGWGKGVTGVTVNGAGGGPALLTLHHARGSSLALTGGNSVVDGRRGSLLNLHGAGGPATGVGAGGTVIGGRSSIVDVTGAQAPYPQHSHSTANLQPHGTGGHRHGSVHRRNASVTTDPPASAPPQPHTGVATEPVRARSIVNFAAAGPTASDVELAATASDTKPLIGVNRMMQSHADTHN